MRLYLADCRQNEKNTIYRTETEVNSLSDFKKAMRLDHLAPKMESWQRSNDNFLEADAVVVDLDNTHSSDPADWKTLDDVAEAFPDVLFYWVQSRNYMKIKTDKKGIRHEAREKWHIYFPMSRTFKSFQEYKLLLLKVAAVFPYFDLGAAKPAQPFYGVSDPVAGKEPGELFIDEYMDQVTPEEYQQSIEDFKSRFDQTTEAKKAVVQLYNYFGIESEEKDQALDDYELCPEGLDWIRHAGQRQAIRWLENWTEKHDIKLGTRYKIDTKDHPGAVVVCVTCPWEDSHTEDTGEKQSVIIIDMSGKLNYLCRHGHCTEKSWTDYRAYYEAKNPDINIKPDEFSDVEQASIFYRLFGDRVRYSTATRYLVYNGSVWIESELQAKRLSQLLTDRQLEDARKALNHARRVLDEVIESGSDDKAAKAALRAAEKYRKEIIKRRSTQKITATLTEAAPRLEILPKELDADGYLLNTPGGTVNLRTGEVRPHDPKDYCTKITAATPGSEGASQFDDFLDQITCDDADLKRYLQELAGSFALGVVKQEELSIVTGPGGNGKSTFFNLLFRVLGDYAGLISSDILITGNRKNKSPELAELRGKRMILAAELDEGTRLDAGIVKRLASTDPIRAEKKYKDPFDFMPSHSVILYTNHLPRVGARDSGTWDRLKVIPFNARFRNASNEVKDYASVLFERCGGAVMSWIIEGAKKYIANGYKIELPDCVKDAIEEYKRANDWLGAFLSECCVVDVQERESAGELYKAYRRYCEDMGEYARHVAEFKEALIRQGMKYKKTKTGAVYRGVRLKKIAEQAHDVEMARKEA